MSPLFKYMISGVSGGLIVLGGLVLTERLTSPDDIALSPQIQATPVSLMNRSPKEMGGDFVEASRKSTGSVVHILAEQTQSKNRRRSGDPFEDLFADYFFEQFQAPKNGSGSGVIYSTDGYIITNNHVVGFADKIVVTDHEGKKYDARKVGVDESTDLAVLKIESNKPFTAIRIGDSESIQVGEWVLAVGNPFGYLSSTVTAGIVSAKGRSLDIIQNEKAIEEFIQTDAAINPGNSGGALVNLNGELVGINTAIATPNGVFAGYSFAIPTKIVNRVVKDIISSGGNIERTGLGVGGYDVNEDLVKELKLNLPQNTGFYIESIDNRSAAQLGGLIPGDVIIEINSQPVVSYDDIEKIMKYSKVGDKLNITVVRNGKNKVIPIQLRKTF
jgi:serine protease Do